MNFFKHCVYAGRAFQGEHGAMSIIYPPNISDFVDDKNRQIVTNFVSVLFNNQVNSLKHDGNICTFRTGVLASLLNHKKYLKIIAG